MHVYVDTPADEDGYPPFVAEEIHAEEVGPGLARLTGIPVFAYGIARGDVVQLEVRRDDDRAWAAAVVMCSDHWTSRVITLLDEDLERIAAAFDALGCDAQPTSYGVVAVDVPPEVPQAAVLELLAHGHQVGRWDYDLGVDPRVSPAPPQPARARLLSLLGFGHGRRRRRSR